MSQEHPVPRPQIPTARLLANSIRRPRLYTQPGEPERHVTWLELFFDLVFVVAVAELAHMLHEEMSIGGLAVFVALFVPIWWQWLDFSYYADQYDTNDGFSQIITLIVMLGIVIMALTIHKVTHGGSAMFAASYAALRAIIVGLYAWAWRSVPEARELAGRYTLSFAVALVIWCVSLFVPEPTRFVLWAIALLIEISNGPITYATIKQVPAQVSHMDERFGLFVIIVLGEAVIAVVSGVASSNWVLPAVLSGLGGFILAGTTWWMYFSHAERSAINAALRSDWRGLLRSFAYGYSHFFVFAGITAAGVGIEAAILAEEPLHLPERVALAGGVAMFLFGVTSVQRNALHPIGARLTRARIIGGLICVALIPLGGMLPASALIGVLVATMLGLMAFEITNRKPAAEAQEAGPEAVGAVELPGAEAS